MGDKFNSGAKGQAQLIAIFLLLVLVPTTVIVAQNATNSTGVDGMITDVNLTETLPIEDILNETLPEDTEGNTTIPEENVTDPHEPETDITEPEENVTVINETNVTVPEENITIPDENVTIPEENATLPEENTTSPEENITEPTEEPEVNITEPEENVTETNVTEESLAPEITLVIENPDKVTRDKEDAIVKAVITNTGGTSYNLVLEWMLPEGFAVVEGNATEHIGVLENSGTFISEIKVFPVLGAPLGPAEIRARVSYE